MGTLGTASFGKPTLISCIANPLTLNIKNQIIVKIIDVCQFFRKCLLILTSEFIIAEKPEFEKKAKEVLSKN